MSNATSFTKKHTFYECPSMARVEEKVRRMREKEKLPTSISSWWKALIDNNDPPGKRGQTTFYKKIILGLAEGT